MSTAALRPLSRAEPAEPGGLDELGERWEEVAAAVFAIATMLVATLHARAVFSDDFHVLPLGAVAIGAGAMMWAARREAPAVRLVAIAVVAVVGAALSTWSAGGSPIGGLSDVPGGFGDIVATVYPAPVLAGAVGALGGLAAFGSAVAVELTTRRKAVAALLPSLGMLGVVALLTAEHGPPGAWLLGAYVAMAVGVLRQRTGTYRSRVSGILAVGVAVLVGCITLAFATVTTGDRYDPRDQTAPPALPDVGISPLARLGEWRSRTPVSMLFTSTLRQPTRWRLVALTRYDGRTWMPDDDYRPASSQVGDVDEHRATTDISVTLGDLEAPWLPTPDRPVRVSVPVRIDGGRSGLYTDLGLQAGTSYDLQFQSPATPDSAALATASRAAPSSPGPFVDGFQVPAAIDQLAASIVAGATSDYDQAQRIAVYLQTRYELDETTPPGHSFAVEQLFLQRTLRGRDEQFVAAFGILAAAVGLPVRLAVGFDSSVDEERATTIVASNQSVAWAEVDFDGVGWVAFDPLPAARGDLPEITEPEGASGSTGGGAIPTESPPTTATPQSPLPPQDPQTEVAPVDAGAGARVTTTMVLVLVALGVVVVAIAYVAVVVIVKRRRRQRRATDEDLHARAVGAFSAGVDVLVDLGARTRRSMTDRELVVVGRSTLGDVADRLEPVARLATASVFGEEPTADDTDSAWREIDAFEREAAERVGRLRHLRSQISARSLRRTLRGDRQA